MAETTRRRFLAGSTAALLLGCKGDARDSIGLGDSHSGAPGTDSAPPTDSDTESETDPDSETGEDTEADTDTDTEPCEDPFAGGELLATLLFLGEDDEAVGYRDGEGLDGRLALDLSTLDEESLVQDNDSFYLRTFEPVDLESTDWRIPIRGLVEADAEIRATEIDKLAMEVEPTLLECSGNGSNRGFGLMSAARWSGMPVEEVLSKVSPTPGATRVRIRGYDEHPPSTGSVEGAAWVFTVEELSEAGAFFATRMNGEPLPADHGGPVRLVVPGWFGCCCIKWVDEIAFVDDSEPASSQMIEFASRTHQEGAPALAADYAPARIQQAAMPVRVEKWQVKGQIRYRIIGILWGGERSTDALTLSFNGASPVPVELCPPMEGNRSWTLWEHSWEPEATGLYSLTCHIDDPSIDQIRLDDAYYARLVEIDQI